MLLCLGQFVFSVDTLMFNEIQRKRGWDYASNDIAQGRNQYQFTGLAEETVSIPFNIYEAHGFGKRQALDDLAEMADSGSGFVLVDGSGYLYGVFAITSIDETRTILVAQGVPRKIDGTLSLTRVDDERIQTDQVNANASVNAGGV